jgi:hypothetical protein
MKSTSDTLLIDILLRAHTLNSCLRLDIKILISFIILHPILKFIEHLYFIHRNLYARSRIFPIIFLSDYVLSKCKKIFYYYYREQHNITHDIYWLLLTK